MVDMIYVLVSYAIVVIACLSLVNAGVSLYLWIGNLIIKRRNKKNTKQVCACCFNNINAVSELYGEGEIPDDMVESLVKAVKLATKSATRGKLNDE